MFPTCFYLIKSSVDTSRSIVAIVKLHTCACIYTGWSVIHGHCFEMGSMGEGGGRIFMGKDLRQE